MHPVRLYIAVLLVIHSAVLYAQSSTADPLISAIDTKMQVKPPSAEAQSLGSFAEIPVDLYTGTVNISIPIYTVTQNDIQVPVSLSYHGGGIKVTDECGLVGLGWTLNVGGVISRIVRGFPDELNDYDVAGYDNLRFFRWSSLNRFPDFIGAIKNHNGKDNPAHLQEPKTAEDFEIARWIEHYGPLYDDGHFDTSPDNYVFSVQDLSGAFVGTEVSYVQSNQGCRITRKNDRLYQIEDANGYTYSFGAVERQLYPFKVGLGQGITDWNTIQERTTRYNSAWWLTSICSHTGDSVVFRYSPFKQRHFQPHLYAFAQCVREDPVVHHEVDSYYSYPKTTRQDTTYHQLLSEIETTLCRVRFHYTMPADVSVSPRLDSISVYSLTEQNALLQRCKFVYSGNGSRAKLIKVIQQGSSGTQQRYHFRYNPSSARPALEVNDDRRDHWGYYAPQSTGWFEKKTYLSLYPAGLSNDKGANRYASRSTAAEDMLCAITYPSGLTSTFDWEPHDFSLWGELGQTAHKEDNFSVKYEPVTEVVDSFDLCGKENQESLSVTRRIRSGQTITIDMSQYYYNEYIKKWLHCVGDWHADSDYPTPSRPKLVITRNDKEILSRFIDTTTCFFPVTISASRCGEGTYKFELLNPRGTLNDVKDEGECSFYRYIFSQPESDYGRIHISISETKDKEVVIGDKQAANVGGVRIKRITYQSGANDMLIKEYQYVNADGTSSGVLTYPPRHASSYPYVYKRILVPGAMDFIIEAPHLLMLRSNGLPFSLNGGSHIEYARVVEASVSGKGNGKTFVRPANLTEYCYATSADLGCADIDDTDYGTQVPADMLQLTSQAYRRGHLVSKQEYTDEHKTTTYTYDIREESGVSTVTGAIFTTADFREVGIGYADNIHGGTVYPYKNLGIVEYRVIPYNKRLVNQTTTGDKTNTFHSYTYANVSYYSAALNVHMPVTHTTLDAVGDTITQHFTYLSSTNKVTSCITTKQGYIIDAYRYDYDSRYRVIARYTLPIPSEGLPMTSSLSWQQTDSYTYDSVVNQIVEHTDHIASITTTYLWSYRGSYPVAKIVNASYADVVAIVGTQNLRQLTMADAPASLSMLTAIANRLPQCHITKMRYKPLVGVTSITDPMGYTIQYLYDDFGRLQEVYEPNGRGKRILQHIDYHLINP